MIIFRAYILTEAQPRESISSRIASPGELFSSDFQACAQSPHWAMRCALGSVSCSCDAAPRTAVRKRALPVASSLLSEQQRTWLIFAEQIEIFLVKAWLVTFKARNANLKLLDDDVEKEKKTTRSTCGGRSHPPPSIHHRSPQPQSLQILFQICRVWCLYPLKRSFLLSTKFAFFSTKPCGTKLFSGPLEASRKRSVDGASTVRRLSLRMTRFNGIWS